MLQSLHVKNLALIQETEVTFKEGLNILTGETGAGKSLLLGSINLALGGKFEKDMLRKGEDSALVELIFVDEDKRIAEKLTELDLEQSEDGTVIISRKLQATRSVCKINGETVTAKQVKELAELLLDIHGQHEHQSLLNKRKHQEILDSFCGEAFLPLSREVAECYKVVKALRNKLDESAMDEETKAKEQALAEFECNEIQAANLTVGEDEELERRYRLMVNSKRIMEGLSESYRYTGNDSEAGAGNALSRALRSLRSVTGYDARLEELEAQLTEMDNLLADYNRDVAAYMSDCEFDGEDFAATEERLNIINHLKGKYGKSIEEILDYLKEKQLMLERLTDYEAYISKLREELGVAEACLQKACARLSGVRMENAQILTEQLKRALSHLNFVSVEFEVAVRPEQTITALGYDDVEFLISTNPGESLKPLGQVASGGELSRVMLAIKTVLASRDVIDTLIFDEIDAGISGKTAWRVSEQLDIVGKAHQVICITHLPQIAAMADRHYVIEKSSVNDNTITDIHILDEQESLGELARLLGSDSLTEAALSNAREMRAQALQYKAR